MVSGPDTIRGAANPHGDLRSTPWEASSPQEDKALGRMIQEGLFTVHIPEAESVNTLGFINRGDEPRAQVPGASCSHLQGGAWRLHFFGSELLRAVSLYKPALCR